MNALAFRNTQFDIIDRNGQPWLRGHQIGVALGYARTDIIHKLYRKHAEEFTDSMTAVVKLADPNGTLQETRIFSPRGCYALGMFARTKIAAEFRRWVLDVLEQKTSATPQLPTLTNRRWCISFDHQGKESVTPIPDEAVIMTMPQVLKRLGEHTAIDADHNELVEFAIAIIRRLARRTDYFHKQWLAASKKR